MSDENTPNLSLPYLAGSQAQKHVTHNEALRMLDALVQISLLDRDLGLPPPSPANGDRYLVAAPASGAWAGQAGSIAAWQDGAWSFFAPGTGWLAWIADEKKLLAFDGTGWVATVGRGPLQDIAELGVNASSDATNRLAAKSDAVLFNHDDVTPGSGDVRVKLNKASAPKTASCLFQTGSSGRAELGTMGSDGFAIKVSANGSSWTDALRIDSASGNIGIGTAPSAARLELGAGSFRAGGGIFERPVGQASEFYYQRSGVSRWNFGMSNAAESSGNAGSDFYINRYADNGAYLGTPFSITRSTGAISLFGDIRSFGIRGAADNAYSLGTAAARWSEIWAANGVIQTSDARDKTDVERMPSVMALALVDAVEPVLFRWATGGQEVFETAEDTDETVLRARPGKRRHAGFLAQDVKTALDGLELDFGAWGLEDLNDASSRQWLRPDQLIPVLWAALRGMRAQLRVLNSRVK